MFALAKKETFSIKIFELLFTRLFAVITSETSSLIIYGSTDFSSASGVSVSSEGRAMYHHSHVYKLY